VSDITKCSGVGCPLKDMCFRFTAPGSERQAYFTTPPVKDNKCDMFWGEASNQLMNQLQSIVNGKS